MPLARAVEATAIQSVPSFIKGLRRRAMKVDAVRRSRLEG